MSQVYFTSEIDRYFAHWILKATWFKGHDLDMERFYQFVLALHEYGIRPGTIKNIDRTPLKENISKAVKNNHQFNETELDKYADKYAAKAMLIIDFLEFTSKGLTNLDGWEPHLK